MQKLLLKNWSEKKQNIALIFGTWFIFLSSAGISCYLIGEIVRWYFSILLNIQTAKHEELIKQVQMIEKEPNFYVFGIVILLTIIMVSVTIKYLFKLRIE